jgi:TM2 domain-containing membrane protein YozV
MLAVSSQYVVVKKYAITPAIQSMILPGWGQIYNDQPGKGAIFAVLGLASGASFGLSYLLYQNLNYDLADSREAAADEYKKWENYHKINKITLATSVAIWGVAVVDAFLVARKNLKTYSMDDAKLSVNIYGDKIGAELTCKF